MTGPFGCRQVLLAIVNICPGGGHASAAMTTLDTGEIPLEQIRAEFSIKFGSEIDVLETMENNATA